MWACSTWEIFFKDFLKIYLLFTGGNNGSVIQDCMNTVLYEQDLLVSKRVSSTNLCVYLKGWQKSLLDIISCRRIKTSDCYWIIIPENLTSHLISSWDISRSCVLVVTVQWQYFLFVSKLTKNLEQKSFQCYGYNNVLRYL